MTHDDRRAPDPTCEVSRVKIRPSASPKSSSFSFTVCATGVYRHDQWIGLRKHLYWNQCVVVLHVFTSNSTGLFRIYQYQILGHVVNKRCSIKHCVTSPGLIISKHRFAQCIFWTQLQCQEFGRDSHRKFGVILDIWVWIKTSYECYRNPLVFTPNIVGETLDLTPWISGRNHRSYATICCHITTVKSGTQGHVVEATCLSRWSQSHLCYLGWIYSRGLGQNWRLHNDLSHTSIYIYIHMFCLEVNMCTSKHIKTDVCIKHISNFKPGSINL